jgi:hypothetical protein
MVLGHVIAIADGESHSIIKKKWLTKIFVIGDILAFTVQAGVELLSLYTRVSC